MARITDRKRLLHAVVPTDGVHVDATWKCNKCVELFQSYRSLVIHKQNAHSY